MEIILLTDYRGFLRQHLTDKVSMNIEKIKKILSSYGYNVTLCSYEKVINEDININNKIVIYTSSQNKDYKNYIDDALFALSKKNTLIPRYEIFKAHENKGYQEILKKELGINSLNAMYFGNKAGLNQTYYTKLNYPLIIKRIDGAGSTNVYKANNTKELFALIKKMNKPKGYQKSIIIKYFTKYILPKSYNQIYYDEDVFMGQFIIQEFMEGLKDDWKVLVFYDKYYVLNRKIRDNDFRASGSGLLSYIEPPKEVLEYAKKIFEKLDVPFVSLDIGYDGKSCNLIEYQGTHFGPYTIIYSDFYYTYQNKKWEKIDAKSNFEEEYALSLIKYIERKS